jgi:uncharacterized protein (TIGR02646 family)
MTLRRLARTRLESSLNSVLEAHQTRVNSGKSTARDEWDRFRRTASYKAIRKQLSIDAGARERCFYCSDSLGTDIEHYRPKATYCNLAFDYRNFLLVCTACNRAKGSRFPIDGDGNPLLLDPAFDDPWDSLFLDETTGLLIPRIYPGNRHSLRGIETLRILGAVVNRDSVTLGRAQQWRNLISTLEHWRDRGAPSKNCHELISLLTRDDQYGLVTWALKREGAECPEVLAIRHKDPELWVNLRDCEAINRLSEISLTTGSERSA